MKFLEKIRNKSNLEKREFAFNASFLITAVIFIIWAVTVFYSFDISETVNGTKAAISPIKSIISSFKSLFN
jgi:hypothetical protein